MIRKVCAQRARKLRKKGTYVWWSLEHNSYVWEMPALDKREEK